ncbi:MAG: ABC transporter ATP-binding protein [Bacteroidales bacterium]|nr:ABC transporter ATP-binding protein [Bacteroidales bacterium]MCF8345075.1 ABC transporter ATP-binding protein [Bacteroidales bacterium]MCF8350986.1 ABC transporter ATP-binding protein [Bacteroidales bacterium]MCF8376110.1 ABC transporter ATP-binding protein [Bacteroidales bacterium]MCF8401423.1 ABC transporter ATP-binding protein [Bacteroidales bacterium]
MLKIENIDKKFKGFHLQQINLEVEQGEYFMLLGKSGSGKSLILEILAGMQKPDSGKVVLRNKEITHLDIRKRNIGLLFQDNAIFSHLSVFDNIAYPLRSKGFSKKEINRKANQLAKDFDIGHLTKRKTTNLSGGETQRVALARTLAMKPDLLLLDEPLTSLDVQLRQGIRKLLRKINRQGQTIIHVTHDHEEAILLADRVAVINQGKIIQSGTTEDVFHYPKNEFVANFTGIKNFFMTSFKPDNSQGVYLAEIKPGLSFKILQKPHNTLGSVILRCQDIILSKNKAETTAVNNFQGTIMEILPALNGFELLVDIGIRLSVLISRESLQKLNLEEGMHIWVSFKASAVRVLG